MIKAIIIDDEINCCEILKIRLEKFSKEIEVIAEANNIIDAEVLIKKLQPDVVFLDIQMSGGSGFDMLKSFPEPEFEIVFITAFNEYAIKALKLSALDYLLKPIDPDELEICINKIKNRFQNSNKSSSNSKLHLLQTNIDANNNKLLRLVVPLMNGFEIIKIEDIIYCRAESNYTRFFNINNAEYLVCKTLKEFEDILSGLSFYRIHNSYLINLNHVKGFSKGKNGTVVMTDGTSLTVSRQKKSDFMDFFMNG